MDSAPAVIVFDVNETLSDMTPMADRFEEIGAPRWLAETWFASVLRDGFALTAAGRNEKFASIARGALQSALGGIRGGHTSGPMLTRPIGEAVEHIMNGFGELPLHADVVAAVTDLSESGFRLVTLSNGSSQIADRLFRSAGIRDHFELLLSVEDAPGWKPQRSAYDYAAERCGLTSEQMLLTAVHPWDIDGAASAGLATAWINRADAAYPAHFTAPHLSVSSLGDLASLLGTDSAKFAQAKD